MNNPLQSNKMSAAVLLGALLAGCVTINIYFPASAAEKAADTIIDEVWQMQGKPASGAPGLPAAPNVSGTPGVPGVPGVPIPPAAPKEKTP